MLNRIILGSLRRRTLVLLLAGVLLLVGGAAVTRTPIDIFPDLSAPTVAVITEATGMATEEVEILVTFPIESALNGAPGVRRVRSISAAGISVIWVEFLWETEIYRARQIVAERLPGVELPTGVDPPRLGAISSVMGEIMFLAMTSDTVSPMELRRLADTVVKRSLLAIPGVSHVVPIGGEVRQYQVEADPAAMIRHGVTLDDLVTAVSASSRYPSAGFHVDSGQEYLVRGLGLARTPQDLAAAVVRTESGVPLTVGNLASVAAGPEPLRGTAAYKALPAVVISVQKQPEANTLALTAEIDRVLEEIAATLPEGVRIETENFRQADFIGTAIQNVTAALRDGAILVVLILFFFLGNIRTTIISTIAIPLSALAGILAVSALGGTLNTMSLGGIAIAVGALVDDAIIDVENVFRRLREEREKPAADRRPALDVVFQGSSEVRGAILYATLIIILVFLPLFILPGMEGRLLRPLGLAYVAALTASLVVSVTITPVLCLLLLPSQKLLARREPWLLRTLKAAYGPTIRWALAHRRSVIVAAMAGIVPAVGLLMVLGRSFLPPFNEGALTVSVVSPPGITLDETDALGRQVEAALLAAPEVVSTSRRTGRAEKDEHVQGVNASELEVVLRKGRPKEMLLAELRRAVSTIPGVVVSFGQPISHRIDHMISGSKSNLAVKLFGPDLAVLRKLSESVEEILRSVPGIVDLSNQEQATVPQLLVEYDRKAMARYGLTPEMLSRTVEALFQGTTVGEIPEEGIVTRVVVRFPPRLRGDRETLDALPVPTPSGAIVRLGDVARLRFDLGPSVIRRENVARVALLSANIAGADLTGTVDRARAAVSERLDLPPGYRIVYGGQFEEAARGFRNMALMAVAVLAAMYALLFFAFRSHRHALIVLVNLPLALIGGIFAVTLGAGVLNVASLVGFITLFGIATRNGVLLVSHYRHLIHDEGMPLADAVFRGSMERLAPVLMTALTAGLALIPLVLRGGEPGNEIQSPMGQVILGGLLTSTFLNLIVVPVLFARWGGRADPRG